MKKKAKKENPNKLPISRYASDGNAHVESSEQLLQCCGCFGVEGFPFDDDATGYEDVEYDYSTGYGGASKRVWVPGVNPKSIAKSISDAITPAGRERKDAGFMNLAIVTAEQKLSMKALVKLKFKRLAKWRNANSGVMCYLYGKVVK